MSKLKLGTSIVAGATLLAASAMSYAVPFGGTPSPTLSPVFGTLIDFDDKATGTSIGAGDYAAMGLASITETTGSGASFARYASSQSSPNYIGTGFGYETGGASSGWDGTFLFEFAALSDMVGIGLAGPTTGTIAVYDSGMSLLESSVLPYVSNTYLGFDRLGSFDVKYLKLSCDFCALDDLQFTKGPSSAVSEPATVALLGLGLTALVSLRRKSRA